MNELPRWLKQATVWLLIAVAVFLGVQAWQAQRQRAQFSFGGGQVELQRGADGHYRWPGQVADRRVEFLVDTGATGTAIPLQLARELGLRAIGRVRTDTAGGEAPGVVVVGSITLEGGVRVERLRMTALPGLAGPLLGMDVLGRLRLQQDRGVLRIDLGAGG